MEDRIIFHQQGKDSLYKIWHTPTEHMMLIYMYSDGGSIVFSDKIYPIKKGALCFIGSRKYHYTMPDNPDTYDRSKLNIPTESFFKMLSLFPEKSAFYTTFTADCAIYAQIPPKEQANVEKLFEEVKEYEAIEKYSEILFISCYMKLLVYLDRYAARRPPSPSGFAAKSIQYINDHIAEEITIDDICAVVHMSKYHFCRRFKSILGITVMEYILKTRLAAAKTMLKEEDHSISEISEKCGFSSISYFCRVFKEETGMTALSYRKKYMK